MLPNEKIGFPALFIGLIASSSVLFVQDLFFKNILLGLAVICTIISYTFLSFWGLWTFNKSIKQ